MSSSQDSNPDFVPRGALIAVLVALVPLIIFAVDLLSDNLAFMTDPAAAVRNYSVLLLAFTAGARWGLAVPQKSDHDDRDMLWALVPLFLTFASMALSFHNALVALMVGFAAHGAWDSLSLSQSEDAGWYVTLRILSTLIIVAILITVWWTSPTLAALNG